jgi:hypothetical protein
MGVGKWLRGWKVNRMASEFCNVVAINFGVYSQAVNYLDLFTLLPEY